MSATEPEESGTWTPTFSLHRVAGLSLLALGTGLVFGRPDVALLALPLAVGAAWSWSTMRPAAPVRAISQVPGLAEQRAPTFAVLAVEDVGDAQALVLHLPDQVRGDLPQAAVLRPHGHRHVLQVPIDTGDWGVHDLGHLGVRAVTADGLFVSPRARSWVGEFRVLPVAAGLDAPELPARAAGRTGAHRTRRPGDGTELLDVREFRPGDRIRRIDWRVSARRPELHVRHTAADADADLVLCLDTRWDVDDDVASWAKPADGDATRRPSSSLTTAVGAATTLAQTYLRLGDRVGLVDLNLPSRSVPPGTGPRQLMRMRWQLAGTTADRNLRRRLLPDHLTPRGAVTIVLTPFLDRDMATHVATMARARRDVVLVDTLPPPRLPTERRLRTAARLLLAERTERLAALQQLGVLVTPWDPVLVPALLRRRQHLQRRRSG